MRRAAAVLAVALAVFPSGSSGARLSESKLRPSEIGFDEAPGDWSPDGRAILVARSYEPPRGGADYALALVGANGRLKRELYRKPQDELEQWDSPGEFSPDGSKVVFNQRYGLELTRVLLVNTNGRGRRILTRDGSDSSNARWSPDGRLIAFTRRDTNTRSRSGIWLMLADGSGQRQLTAQEYDSGPLWSPSGSSLLFTRTPRGGSAKSSVWSVGIDGGGLRRLTRDGAYTAHGWSPDGKLVLYTHRGGYFETKASMWSMNADGSGKRRLAAGDRPRWSPDGARIAFMRWPQTSVPHTTTYVMNADGRRLRRLFPGGAEAVWAPDGRRLAVSAQRDCNGAGVYVIAAASGRARRVTNDCRIVGTHGDDRLFGTRERDLVRALNGDDVVDANPGNRPKEFTGRGDDDLVDGGAGDDRIWGRRGPDVLRGGPGRDRLDGGAGDDSLSVRDGARDIVRCGPGHDRVVADRLDEVAQDCERVVR